VSRVNFVNNARDRCRMVKPRRMPTPPGTGVATFSQFGRIFGIRWSQYKRIMFEGSWVG